MCKLHELKYSNTFFAYGFLAIGCTEGAGLKINVMIK